MRFGAPGCVMLVCFVYVLNAWHSDAGAEGPSRATPESPSGNSGDNVASLPAAVRTVLDTFFACSDNFEIRQVNPSGEYRLCRTEVVWSPGSVDQLRACLKRRSLLDWRRTPSYKTSGQTSYLVSLSCSDRSWADIDIEGSAESYRVDEIDETMP
jgi:hypothetical protein